MSCSFLVQWPPRGQCKCPRCHINHKGAPTHTSTPHAPHSYWNELVLRAPTVPAYPHTPYVRHLHTLTQHTRAAIADTRPPPLVPHQVATNRANHLHCTVAALASDVPHPSVLDAQHTNRNPCRVGHVSCPLVSSARPLCYYCACLAAADLWHHFRQHCEPVSKTLGMDGSSNSGAVWSWSSCRYPSWPKMGNHTQCRLKTSVAMIDRYRSPRHTRR